jgi:nucleotide-binding universal stress UspA family protein
VTTVMRQQKPEELLVELSADAELIVVGTHGLNRFLGALVGSVSQRLAAHALCPVVVLPPPGVIHHASAARTVVVGVSPSPGGISALRFAMAEAQLRDAEVLAVRSWNAPAIYGLGTAGIGFISPAPFESLRESGREVLEHCLGQVRAAYPDVTVRSELLESAADVTLVDYSQAADLLVVGCRHEDGHPLSRLGPVTSWLLHNSAAPIAVVGFSSNSHAAPQPDHAH